MLIMNQRVLLILSARLLGLGLFWQPATFMIIDRYCSVLLIIVQYCGLTKFSLSFSVSQDTGRLCVVDSQ